MNHRKRDAGILLPRPARTPLARMIFTYAASTPIIIHKIITNSDVHLKWAFPSARNWAPLQPGNPSSQVNRGVKGRSSTNLGGEPSDEIFIFLPELGEDSKLICQMLGGAKKIPRQR